MSRPETPSPAGAADQADRALVEAGLTVRELDDIDDLLALSDVIDRVWRRTTPMIEHGLLRAISESGGYVVGAWSADDLVGGVVAFRGARDDRPLVHSHVTGFVDDAAGGGRGRALKLHQRAWCLARGIEIVEWTFDPLVRRNAWFNLQRLGVTVARYETNYYGSLRDDAINGADESDRFVAEWHLASDEVHELADGLRREPDEAGLLAEGAAHEVDEDGRRTGAEPLTALVRVPDDVVAFRSIDPEAARRWRHSTRASLAPRLAAGQRVQGFTRSGSYVVGP